MLGALLVVAPVLVRLEEQRHLVPVHLVLLPQLVLYLEPVLRVEIFLLGDELGRLLHFGLTLPDE